MSQSLLLKIKGLYTSVNELSEIPEGALLTADNINIDQDSVAEPRKGFDRLSAGFTTTTDRAAATWFYQDKQFVHHGTLGSEDEISYLDTTWTSVGSYSAPTGARIRTLRSNQNLYFSTSTGVYKLDAYDSTAVLAGAYKGLDITASIPSPVTAAWLADEYRCAYRVVWGYKDANNNLILGAPSQRESIKNTSGATADISIRITIPAGITAAWFYQVYRSSQVDCSVTDTEPSEELQLVYEGNPEAADIAAGYVDVLDIVPDELRGTTIYTAASQDGLVQQNERPPLCKDMAVFRDTIFYANTTSKHRYYLNLLAVGGTSGIAADDTVTIGGVAYTGKAAEDIAAAEFDVVTGGSASQNIRDTCLSLVRVINRHTSSTVNAYYLSGVDDLPGKILLEERGIGGSAFACVSSVSACWSPSLPSSGTTESSSNDRYKNGMAWSKFQKSEAVPLTNFQLVGSKDDEILRVIPLKEALYIFKEEGIYKLSGSYPNFTVELLDSSAKLLAPETCAILNNQIFCLTDQGVSVIQDSVKIISRPIEQDLLKLFGSDLDLVKSISFGISYETDRKYYLFLPNLDGDAYPTQAYVYNTFTQTWVRHLLNSTCGTVSDNRLYLGDALSNYMLQDRKSYSYLDYADFGFATSISSISGTSIVVASGSDNISIGDIIYQSDTVFAIVTAVDTITSTLTVETDPGFTAASCDILEAISCDIAWAPITSGNPGITKQLHTALMLFKSDYNGTGYLTFNSDLSQYDESVPLEGTGIGSWGLFSWGERPWGGANLKRPIRQWVPRNKQRCSQLTVSFQHSYGYSAWQLEGISLFGTPGTEKIGR